MTWVAWRLQRTETLIAAGMLLALVALLVPTGIQMSHAFHDDGVAACLSHPSSGFCNDTISSFTQRFSSIGNFISWLTLLPGLVGVLLAAPYVMELEQGTHRLAWTQSITRRRWITGKLGLAIVTALLAMVVFTQLVTWWRSPLVRIDGRMDNSVFDSEGIVAYGYVLFALGLAVAVGVVWRRAVAALLVSFVGYFAVRLFGDLWLRQHLTPPRGVTFRFGRPEPAVLNHAWIISEHPVDAGGGITRTFLCLPGMSKAECARNAPAFIHAVYEPASRFWAMQGVETAVFGGVALLLLAFAAWWTHERA
jgi:hypothetical protein